jgi:hypothetical protein
MDKKVEKSNCGKVLRRFTNHIKTLEFTRVKPTFWVREKEHFVQFIHIHKYTFGPYFRIHTCVRPFNASFKAIALTGPTEKELVPDVSFEYAESEESIEQCSIKMASFVLRYSEPWFKKWHSAESLLSESSPLDKEQKMQLKQALEGNVNSEWVNLTKALLKIA